MKSTLQEAFNGVFGSFLRPIFGNFGETKFFYFDNPGVEPAGMVLQSHLKKKKDGILLCQLFQMILPYDETHNWLKIKKNQIFLVSFL